MKYFCSIIIPFKNSEKTISKCIQSLIKQNGNTKYEIILINDFSTDRSNSICKMLIKGKNNCKLLKSNTNSSGPGNARNLGIKNANGQYIFFVDSDDQIKKNTMVILEKKINLEKKPDLLCVNYQLVDKIGNFKKKYYRYDLNNYKFKKKKLILKYLNLTLIPQVISNLIKKNTIKKNNISFKKGYFEDVDFYLKVIYYSKSIKILKQKLYLKINRANSIVNSLSKSHINDSFESYYRCYKFLLKKKLIKHKVLKKFFLVAITGQVAVFLKRISKLVTVQKRLNLELFLKKKFFKLQKNIRYKYYFVTKKDLVAKKFLYNEH